MIKKLISLFNQIAHYDCMECYLDKFGEDNYAIAIRCGNNNYGIREHYFCISLFTDRDVEKEQFVEKDRNDEKESTSNKELIYALYWLNTYCFTKKERPIESVDFSPLCYRLDQLKIPNAVFQIYLRSNNYNSEIEVTYRTVSSYWPAKFEYSNKGVKNACDFISIMYSKSLANDKACMHSQ